MDMFKYLIIVNNICVAFGLSGTQDYYNTTHGLEKYSNRHLLEFVSVSSKVLCGNQCSLRDWCQGFNSKKVSYRLYDCGLLVPYPIVSTGSTETDGVYMDREGNLSPGTGNAWDTHFATEGEWIEFHFNEQVLVTSLILYHRCSYGDQCSRWEVRYSDGSSELIDRICNGSGGHMDCTNQPGETYVLPRARVTASLRLSCVTGCNGASGVTGFREVIIYARRKLN